MRQGRHRALAGSSSERETHRAVDATSGYPALERADGGVAGFDSTPPVVDGGPVGRSGGTVALRRGRGELRGTVTAAVPGPVSSSMNHFSCCLTM